MKLISYIFAFSIVLCCSSIQKENIEGEYKKIGEDYIYSLTIKSNHKFTLLKKYSEVESKCYGKWEYINVNEISLLCYEEKFPSQLSSGYMNDRKHKFIILSYKKIQLDNVVLKKKPDVADIDSAFYDKKQIKTVKI